MENEENRGLIDKKASQNQLARFFSCFALDQERKKKARGRKEQARKSGIKQLKPDSLQVLI